MTIVERMQLLALLTICAFAVNRGHGHAFAVEPPPVSEGAKKIEESDGQRTPSIAEVAETLRATLASKDRLEVVSHQRVSFVRRDLTSKEEDAPAPETDALKAISNKDDVQFVDVRICASMTRDSFDVRMWNESQPEPVTEISLALVDDVPTITERHWYPIWNRYREASYPSTHAHGIDELALHSGLFDELKTNVCATAEFFQTWLCEADAFGRGISAAYSIEVETFLGRATYRLNRQGYQDQTADGYSSSRHVYWVDRESHLLVGWRRELVDIVYASHAAYQVIERSYEYRSCDDGSEDVPEDGAVP